MDRPDARVVSEPRTYAPGSPHSYIADLASVTISGLRSPDEARAAGARLQRHGVEVAHEIRRGGREGERALRQVRDEARESNPERHRARYARLAEEARADSTAGASLGSFVTPQFIIDQWAPYRGLHRSFVDATTILPLPDYGMAVHVPSFTAPASGAVQATENTAVPMATPDPSGADIVQPIATVAGQLLVSQQTADRAFRGGGTFDAIAGMQLQQSLNESADRYAVAQVLATAPTVAQSNATFTLANFYQDVAAARNRMTDTAGVRIRPTHVFTTFDLYSFATRQLDAQNRPLIVPALEPGGPKPYRDATLADDPTWWGYTGTVLPGTLFWFADDTIPATGGNTQVLVAAPRFVVTWEGEPNLRVFPQTQAQQLSVLVQLYEYIVTVPRYAGAAAVVTGSAYPTTLQ